MSLSRRSLSILSAIRRARTVPRKLTSTIRALEPWKYRKLLHQGKNEKNGIAEAIPFLSCPTMFSYREAPFAACFFIRYAYYNLRITNPCVASSHKSSSCKSVKYLLCMPKVASGGIYSYWLSRIKRPLPSVLILVTICRHWSMA